MTNEYNDKIIIGNLIETLNMFALYDISVKELNNIIKSSDNVEDLAHNIICWSNENE